MSARPVQGSPLDLRSLLGPELTCKQGGLYPGTCPTSVLDGKHVALYFSAHWCPPCRAFTPKLKKLYLNLEDAGKPFEVVFVSSDRSLEQFEEYYASMPWCAVPFNAKDVKARLSSAFGVQGIPMLVLISPEGVWMNVDARSAVMRDPTGASFPWEGFEGLAPQQHSPWSSIVRAFMLLAAIYYFFNYAWKGKRGS